MSQSSPEDLPKSRSVGPIVGAIAFLALSVAVAILVLSGFDPSALFPAPTSAPVTPTSISPTAEPAATATPITQASQTRALIRLSPPQNDTSGLAAKLPDAIRGALEGAPLAGRAEISSGPVGADDALDITWDTRDDGLVELIIHSRFEPAPVSVESSLTPYSVVGPENTPLIVDPAGDQALTGGVIAAMLELETQPEPGTLDRIRRLQALPSSLTLEQQAQNQAIILYAIAQGQAALGDPTTALDTYSQVLRMHADFPAAELNRGSVYLNLGDATTALATYDSFKDESAFQAAIGYNRAVATLTGDDFNAAIGSAGDLVQQDPASAWRVNLRGYVYFKHGDFAPALDDFKQANSLAPGTPTLLLNQAQTLMALAQFDEAIKVYSTLTVIEPKDAGYRHRLALAFEKAGNTASALDALSQAITLDDHRVDAYLERARLEAQNGDFDKAEADAEKVLALDPNNGPAYEITGDYLLTKEEWVKAEKAYTTAADLGVSTANLFAGRGWAHHRQEKLTSAIADYRQAITLGDTSNLLLLRLGYALIDMNQRKDALNALLGAVNGGMDTAEAHAGLALALDLNNRTDEAEREYQHAVSLDVRFNDREFLLKQPLWSTLSVNRAMAIIKRLK